MSKAPDETTNVLPKIGLGFGLGAGISIGGYPPQSTQNQTPPVISNFSDGSWRIFSMYLERAKEEDEKIAESWQADANGILVFTGLFSAAVASLISVSIQDIQQNPQETSNFYLAGIYQSVTDPNRFNVSNSLPASPPPFSPPTYAVWVNSLWFLSLAISLTSALLATLLQQWARRYLKVTQTHYSLHKQARIRAFFAEGVDKSFLPLAVDALPALVHVSLFLFFAGLVVFLWNVNFTIFKSVLVWVSISMAFYGCITFIPIYRHDSPYHTPLTALMRYVITAILIVFGLLYICFCTLIFCCTCCFGFGLLDFLRNIFEVLLTPLNKVLQLTMQTPEEATPTSPSAIDTRTFMWTFDRLDEDHELESFFLGVPGFHSSNLVKEPLRNLNDAEKIRLLGAIIDFLDRTYSSDLLSDQVKRHREDLCANAVDLVDTPKAFPEILTMFTSKYKDVPAEAVEIGQFVRRWGKRLGQDTIPVYVQAISTFVVAKAKQHNDSWFILASEELGVPDSVLRQHAAHGNSLSLAILIYVIRQQFNNSQNPSWPKYKFSDILEAASEFDAQNTSPELQHDFCAIWNQIVAAQHENTNSRLMTTSVLKCIRSIYISLHQDTNSAATLLSASDHALYSSSTYPVCNAARHFHDDSAPTAFDNPVLQDITELPPASLASPSASSTSVPASLHVYERLTTVPPLDRLHQTQTTIEAVRLHSTTPGSTNADELQDIVTTGTSMPYPSPEAPTIALLHSSTSPTAVVTRRHNTETLTPFNMPNPPLSASTSLVHNNTVPIESHHSIIVPSSPSASPEPTSVPDLGAAAEGGGGATPGFCKEKHPLDPPLVNRTIDVTLDLLEQSTSPWIFWNNRRHPGSSGTTFVTAIGYRPRRSYRRSFAAGTKCRAWSRLSTAFFTSPV